MARTYVPSLLAKLRSLERYIERYDTVLFENVDPSTVNHLNTMLATIKQVLTLES